MQIHNAVITGSFSYNGADLSNVTSSNAYSASLSSRTTNLESTSSVLVGASASFSSILTSVSSSQQQISASLLNVIATGATTGSNSFRANQSITGSLTVTGQIVAQSLNVQQVTSSIVFSSGSNTFGSDLNSRQTFTGSVIMTGSLIVNTTGPELQVTNNGVVIGNLLTDNHSITGSLRVTGSTHAIFGNVGIGTTSPQAFLHIAGQNGTNALTIGASNAFEIFITGSDAANIYHATPNQPIYLNTNGGMLHLGTSSASTLLTISGSNVGIGTTNPTQALVVYKGSASNYLRIQGDNNSGYDIAQEFTDGTNAVYSGMMRGSTGLTGAYTIFTGGAARINVISNGNVGIGITNPSSGSLQIATPGNSGTNQICLTGGNAYTNTYLGSFAGTTYFANNYSFLSGHRSDNAGLKSMEISFDTEQIMFNSMPAGSPGTRTRLLHVSSSGNVGIGTSTPTATLQVRGPNAVGTFFDAQNAGAGGAVFSRINASSSPYNQYVFNNGNVGIGRTPLAQLAVLGGAVQIMGDYPNWQTIIKSAGANGTFTGQLTITIPQMSDGNVDGYGGYSCEVYVAGFEGWYCHAWFSGYINGGITSSEATILRSNGGWSISQASFGANNQGFQFVVNYPTPYIVHPTARIIFNKGGSPNSFEYPANSITAVFS